MELCQCVWGNYNTTKSRNSTALAFSNLKQFLILNILTHHGMVWFPTLVSRSLFCFVAKLHGYPFLFLWGWLKFNDNIFSVLKQTVAWNLERIFEKHKRILYNILGFLNEVWFGREQLLFCRIFITCTICFVARVMKKGGNSSRDRGVKY